MLSNQRGKKKIKVEKLKVWQFVALNFFKMAPDSK
jgi:hypothetical protein